MPLMVAFKFSQEEMPKYYLPGPLASDGLKEQDFCVAPREGSDDVGFVAALEYRSSHQVKPDHPIPSLLRRATEDEVERWWEIKALERRALLTCKQKVLEHKLPMKISTVRYEGKNNKLSYLFTSDKRVDFRALVRDLAALLRCRIELWQIGVREEARVQDGFGVCGLRTCCSAWIKEFKPINLKMAKEQDIDLPPSKLTGQCGRLLCCLAYEVEAYRELSSEALPKGTTVVHARGRGVVVDRNLIRHSYLVADEQGAMSTVESKDIREFALPEQMKHMGKKVMASLARLGAGDDTVSDVNEEGRRYEDEPEGVVASSTTSGVFTVVEDESAEQPSTPPSDRGRTRDRGREQERPRSRSGSAGRAEESRARDQKSDASSERDRTSRRGRSDSRHRHSQRPGGRDEGRHDQRHGDQRARQEGGARGERRDGGRGERRAGGEKGSATEGRQERPEREGSQPHRPRRRGRSGRRGRGPRPGGDSGPSAPSGGQS